MKACLLLNSFTDASFLDLNNFQHLEVSLDFGTVEAKILLLSVVDFN